MTGAIAAISIFVIGGVTFFGLLWLAMPKGFRRLPKSEYEPTVIEHNWSSGTGGGGGGGLYSIAKDPQDYAKIWSDDHK